MDSLFAVKSAAPESLPETQPSRDGTCGTKFSRTKSTTPRWTKPPSDRLRAVLDKLEKNRAQGKLGELAQDEIRTKDDELKRQKQLPLWRDWERAMPTPISRSALFSPICKGNRRHHDNTIIESRPDVLLTFSGKQLDMSDADVFMQAMELAKQHPLGERFTVNRAQFLAAIGRAYVSKNANGIRRKSSIGERQYRWLDEAMERLRKGSLQFEVKQTAKRRGHGGVLNLIRDWLWDDETNTYLLSVEPQICKLFESYSRICLDRHLALPKTDQLAKWMHLYVAGTDKNRLTKIGLDYLRRYSGNSHRRLDHFSVAMQRALQALHNVGVIAGGWFIRDKDLMVGFTRIL